MKSIVLGFCLTVLANLTFAQDVCDELMKFSVNANNAKRSLRSTTKLSMMNQTQIMERDKDGNMYQSVKMDMGGQKMEMETIVIGSKQFTKTNGGDWEVKDVDTKDLEAIKMSAENGQLQFFKNCKKLGNENIDGKNYRVYEADFDAVKMQEFLKTKELGEQQAQAMAMMSAMQMHMKIFIDDKNDPSRMSVKMAMMGQDIDMEAISEYDAVVKIVAPK
jgi:lipopolysaccharide export LptBFGC system permease protein LptF